MLLCFNSSLQLLICGPQICGIRMQHGKINQFFGRRWMLHRGANTASEPEQKFRRSQRGKMERGKISGRRSGRVWSDMLWTERMARTAHEARARSAVKAGELSAGTDPRGRPAGQYHNAAAARHRRHKDQRKHHVCLLESCDVFEAPPSASRFWWNEMMTETLTSSWL